MFLQSNYIETHEDEKGRNEHLHCACDDEGASRKVQAVGTAPHNASTTQLPPHVTGEDDRHLTLASGITTEGEFQQVLTKAQKRRQRSALPPGLAGNNVPSPGTEPAVAPAARPTAPCSSPAPIAPPDVDPAATAGVPRTSVPTSPLTSRTVLFRPAHNGAAFPRTSRLAIAQALSALPGVKEVRVNTKKNIVAADAASPEWTEHLLATSEIAGMPVTARLPTDRTQSSGVVQGVHGNYADEDLLAAVSSKVRVVAAKRQGTTLVLRFSAPYPPARIYLFSMPFEVRPSRPRPLQCLRCGCYGHATATCQRPVRCLRCGGPHQTESCCSSRVRCLHCGGPHPADSPNCQLWQRERRLATIKASAPTHLSHREAQAVLRATPTSSVAAASGPPRVTLTGGKTYAAALGAPDKEATTSINHPQPRLQQHVQQAGAKKRGSIKLGPSPKEAPNQFLERELTDGTEVITGKFVQKLYEFQKDKTVKLARNLTRKHVYPSNLEKMNVLRAVQIFSPQVIAALCHLQENRCGDPALYSFRGVSPTILFMKMMKQWFDVHDMVYSGSDNKKPISDENDHRILWLEKDFTCYVRNIQEESIASGKASSATGLRLQAEAVSRFIHIVRGYGVDYRH
ncbi:hypothetical protein HPB49_014068 [Dermacentor silvarum]|uniref:Uncharacterized protein n=1 Tax=Dermacentor silvarum TaxID=543639 RepID=A0ACB8DDH0_DERSI|nr:hypothetical protein HPB49_014068 [Dermacentor silvarum]